MGMTLAEADALSLFEYEELLFHNNEAYETAEPAAAPDPGRWRSLSDQIASNPLLTH